MSNYRSARGPLLCSLLLISSALFAADSAPATQPAPKYGEPLTTDINPPQTITYKSTNQLIRSILITPKVPAKTPCPSVIIVHDIFGMTPFIKSEAEAIARQGYTVLVPNLYSRQPNTDNPLEANAAWMAYDKSPDQQITRDLSAAVDFLQEEGKPTANQPLAVVGYDMGGIYAMMMAGTDLRISAAVNYYGRLLYSRTSSNRPASPVESLFNLRAPLLSYYGSIDPQIPDDHITSLRSRLANNPNKTFYEIVRYPNVGHGFLVPTRQGYNKDAATQASEKTKLFLAQFLRAEPPPKEE